MDISGMRLSLKPVVGTKVKHLGFKDAEGYEDKNLGKIGTVVPGPEEYNPVVDALFLDVHFEDWVDVSGNEPAPLTVLYMDDSEFEVVG